VKILRSIFGRSADEPARPATPVEVGPDPVLAALAELEVRRLREALAAAMPSAPAPDPEAELQPAARPNRVVKAKASLPEGAGRPVMNIWDLDERDLPSRKAGAGAKPAPAPAPTPVRPAVEGEPERRRPARNKTRILGFEQPPPAVVPLFEAAEAPALPSAPVAPGQGRVMFPTGWLVVKDGPGQGAAFALTQGVSHIGRGADQTVALDFGDMAISRVSHAAVAYDAATHRFHIGHGGKSNLVRLNGRPLLSTEALSDGDEIRIGETTLLLKVLCTAAFNWSSAADEGDGHDMAIA